MRRIRKMLASILVLAMVLGMMVVPASAEDGFKLSVSNAETSVTASEGSEVTVQISASGLADGEGWNALTLYLYYDSEKLTYKRCRADGAAFKAAEEYVSDELYGNVQSQANAAKDAQDADGDSDTNEMCVSIAATAVDENSDPARMTGNGHLWTVTFTVAKGLENQTLPLKLVCLKATVNEDATAVPALVDGSIKVNGLLPEIDTVTLSAETVQVEGGESAAQTLQATAKSLKGTDITSSVVWTVSPADSGVTVNENGLVTIANNAKADEYTVTASAKEGVSAGEAAIDTFTVTRAASVPVRMRLVGADRTIRAQKAGESASGETACSISAKIYDQYGEEATFDGATFVLTLDDNDLGLEQNIANNVYARPTTKAGTVGYTFTFNWNEYTLSERGTITVTKEEPALASVTVEDISATIPVSGSTTKQFIAVAKDQYGADIATAQSWNLSDSPVDAVPGSVSIDIETGVVTITSDAVPGEYEVQVTAFANGDYTNPVDGFATLTLSTINADWSGVTAVTGAEYGVTNEELVNLPTTGELDYTLEAGSSTYDKTLTGVYSVVDGTAVPDAGDFNVEVSFKVLDDAANGEFAGEELFFSVPVTVAKKEVTVSGITAADKTYDGKTDAVLDCSAVTITGKVGSDALTVTATGAFTDKNAGENKTVNISELTLGGAAAKNYVLAADSQQTTATATITPKTVDWSAENIAAQTYTGKAIEVGGDIDPFTTGDTAIVEGDTLTRGVDYTVSWSNNTNVGIAKVYITDVDGGNYKVRDFDYAFEIVPKEVAVNWSDLTKTYNGAEQYPTVTAAGVEGETLNLTVTGETDAGSHEVTASIASVTGGQAKVENYALTEATQTFVIEKAELTPVVDSVDAKTFNGDTTASGTLKLEGICGSDDVTATGTFVWTAADAGTSTVNVTGITLGGAKAANYKLTETSLTGIAAGKSIAKAAAPTLTAPVEQTLLSDEVVTGSKTYTFDLSKIISGVPANAGTVTYAVKTDAGKGDASVSGSTLTVDVPTAQAKGTTDSVVITVSGTNYADADVTVNFEFKSKIDVSALLGMGSDLPTIDGTNTYYTDYGTSFVIEGVYDATGDSSQWTYLYEGTTNAGEIYSSADAPTEAGTYTFTATYEDDIPEGDVPGHIGTVTAELVINKKSVGAVWSNTALTYTGKEQAPSVRATGINGTALDVAVEGGKTDAGSEYVANAALSDDDAANYVLTNATTEFSIAKAVLTPAVDTVDSKIYDGDTDAAGTIKLTGAQNSETPVAEAAFAWTSANAGTATVNVTVALTDAAVNKNYELSTTTLSGVSAAGAAITKKPVTVEWTVGSYTYNGSVQTLPTASFTGVDGTVSCTVTVDGGKEFKNAGEYGFTATEASGNYELSNATTTATVAKAVRTLSFAEDTFRILPGKTVTVAPSFNALDGSGSVVYSTNDKLSNSGNSFTAAGNGTVTITAKVAETANYEASNTVNLTFHVIEEFETEVSDEQKISSNNGTIAAATTKVLGLAEAVTGVEANAKAIAAKADNVAKVPADYETYTIEVVFGATIDVLDDKTSATPASMKLDIEPNYTVYAVSEDGNERTKLETVTLSQLTKAVDLQVTLPSGFEPNVARHTKGNGAVEWLAVTVNGNVATWKQDSFSVVELIEDEREATINFVKDNGTTVTETYDIFDLGAIFPTDSKGNHRFNDWTLEGIAGTHTELTEALWDAIAGQTITATPNFTKNAKPNSTRYGVELETVGGGKASIDRDSVIAGTTVTVTAEPNEGYKVASVKVENAKTGESIYVKANGNAYSFTMPEAGATVTVTFAKIGDYPFTDVPENKYYYDAVLWAVDNGVTTGKTATTFDPNGACTRAQVVTFLWRAAGCPAPTSYDNPFTDVAEDKYYYEAVLWAVENGITSGKTATTFDPNGACTRAQVVTFLWRTAGEPETDRWNSFEDVAFGKYYHDAVVWAVVEGVTGGKTTTTFDPNGICTRGQIVTFLYRYFA